jgi:hypothetical protein
MLAFAPLTTASLPLDLIERAKLPTDKEMARGLS